MNAIEKTIKTYNGMSEERMAQVVYAYHLKMQKKNGSPVKGHRLPYSHTIRRTAKDFKMSIGSAHALIKYGKELKRDNKNARSSKQHSNNQENSVREHDCQVA